MFIIAEFLNQGTNTKENKQNFVSVEIIVLIVTTFL